MRVNISYSVELDDVPKKVVEFLAEVNEKIHSLSEACESSSGAMGKKNYTVAMEQMAAARDVLASMDTQLDDCMHIVAGYSKTIADMSVGASDNSEYPPEVTRAFEDELKRLQEKRDDQKETESG